MTDTPDTPDTPPACPTTEAMNALRADVGGPWTQEAVTARRAELAALRDAALQSPPVTPEGT